MARSAKPLTDAAARRLKPQRARRTVPDGALPGLNFIIQPSGHKSFQMRFREFGKITLGPFDASGRELVDEPTIGMPLTVAAARRIAAEVLRQRALGHNPIADHRAAVHRQRAKQEQDANNTFAAAARAYIEEYARLKTRRWYETARLLGIQPDDLEPIPDGLAQRWVERPVPAIDSHDIWSVVEQARRVGVPGVEPRSPGLSEARPRALFAALSGMFGWLHRHRKIEQNPCAGMHRPSAPRARERTLSPNEVRWYWRASDDVGEPFGVVFKLLLLLGQRLNEVAGMRGDELSADGATWSLPSSRTKNGRPHQVPLPEAARVLIASMQATPDGYVFTTTGTTPVSGWSRATARLRAAMLTAAQEERGSEVTIPAFRLHDARRTFVTGLIEIGIRPDLVERVVNHVSGHQAAVAGIYDRSERLAERRGALERWSGHVAGIVAPQPDKVVSLGKRGSK